MKSYRVLLLVFIMWSVRVYAAQDVTTAVEGTVKKIDKVAKTITVETADGSAHVFRVAARTAVHGTSAAAKDTFHGLKEGSHVAVHYTVKNAEETPKEIDDLSSGTLKAAEGTVSAIDRESKTISLETANGTKEIFHMTATAAVDSGKDIGKAEEKSAKVTVYYTEEAGRKIGHFFKKIR